jgi:hypothetical protein
MILVRIVAPAKWLTSSVAVGVGRASCVWVAWAMCVAVATTPRVWVALLSGPMCVRKTLNEMYASSTIPKDAKTTSQKVLPRSAFNEIAFPVLQCVDHWMLE